MWKMTDFVARMFACVIRNPQVDFSECIYDAYLEVFEKRHGVIVRQVARLATKFAGTKEIFFM